ncbi:unnamed protein product, partial [Thlaspi arvense]
TLQNQKDACSVRYYGELGDYLESMCSTRRSQVLSWLRKKVKDVSPVPSEAEALPRAFAVTVVVAVVTVQWLPYSCSFAEAYPSEDLVVSLPGQPKVGFRQFAGYVNIDSKNGRSLLLLRGSRQTSRHYVPQLADAIHSYNIRSSGFKFNIGNPLLRLATDTSAAYDFFCKKCLEALTEAGLVIEYVNVYDVLLDLCYPSIVEQELRLKEMSTKMSMGVDVCMTFERQFYFNLPEVQHALHANHTRLPYEWAMCSTQTILCFYI